MYIYIYMEDTYMYQCMYVCINAEYTYLQTLFVVSWSKNGSYTKLNSLVY